MTQEQDRVEHLARAVDAACTVVRGVRDDQLDLPTPCASWDVRRLTSHLLGDLPVFEVMATGGQPDWGAAPPELGDGWRERFDADARRLVATWRERADEPDARSLGMQVSELLLHAWDLARATGQQVDVPDEVAEAALAGMQAMLTDAARGSEADGKVFGPEVPAPAGASALDRLAAFSGRRP